MLAQADGSRDMCVCCMSHVTRMNEAYRTYYVWCHTEKDSCHTHPRKEEIVDDELMFVPEIYNTWDFKYICTWNPICYIKHQLTFVPEILWHMGFQVHLYMKSHMLYQESTHVCTWNHITHGISGTFVHEIPCVISRINSCYLKSHNIWDFRYICTWNPICYIICTWNPICYIKNPDGCTSR